MKSYSYKIPNPIDEVLQLLATFNVKETEYKTEGDNLGMLKYRTSDSYRGNFLFTRLAYTIKKG